MKPQCQCRIPVAGGSRPHADHRHHNHRHHYHRYQQQQQQQQQQERNRDRLKPAVIRPLNDDHGIFALCVGI
ncbi:uncharacterized protein THITE_2106874 [Thermothielavioides terrestris NRRL 8126]|uniref:Uncharacterized protein n=1 Tax=Thermothielavioides terrestris (strain ATCC 38088 / NRRL 8126) TaxID=578455 RepID=G2QRX7_THETT|nr:uncharacterized protein THITE_2106874 [Thermothielavioides terrestris NRRL 8126]AEO62564.1 hypothetical protein THITE_2106874 [Thermothielavioides terrestris NRRL 8126]